MKKITITILRQQVVVWDEMYVGIRDYGYMKLFQIGDVIEIWGATDQKHNGKWKITSFGHDGSNPMEDILTLESIG